MDSKNDIDKYICKGFKKSKKCRELKEIDSDYCSHHLMDYDLVKNGLNNYRNDSNFFKTYYRKNVFKKDLVQLNSPELIETFTRIEKKHFPNAKDYRFCMGCYCRIENVNDIMNDDVIYCLDCLKNIKMYKPCVHTNYNSEICTNITPKCYCFIHKKNSIEYS